jgi:hypothetical protein
VLAGAAIGVTVFSGTQGGVTISVTISGGMLTLSTTVVGPGGTQQVPLGGVPPMTSNLSIGAGIAPGVNISGGVEIIESGGEDFGVEVTGGAEFVAGAANGATLVADFGVVDSTTGALIMAGAVSGFVVRTGVPPATLGCAISDITVLGGGTLGGGTLELLVGAGQSVTKVSSSGILEIGSPNIVERVSRLVHVDASVPFVV